MKRIIKRTLKILLLFGLLLIFLIIAFALLTQTQFFRDRLGRIVASRLSQQTNGRVTLGVIHGDFLNGFTIDSLSLTYRDETILRTGKVSFTYEILPFLERKVRIRSCTIEEPVVELRRSASGEWNISRLIKPSTDTSSGNFTGSFRIDNLELRNGTALLVDSAALGKDTSAFRHINYGDMLVRNIFLRMNARLEAGTYEAAIQRAQCNISKPEFELSELSGVLALDANGIRAEHLIVRTQQSSLECDASLRGRHLLENFTLANLGPDTTNLVLKAHKIDFGEMKMFLPPLDFLEGAASINLQCTGTFGNLDVRRLDVNFLESSLHLSGAVRNLHDPERLTLAMTLADCRVDPRDISRLMPPFHIPSFDSTGMMDASGRFTGTPLDFKANIALEGRGWFLRTDGALNLARAVPKYDASFSSSGVNLAHFFPTASLSSSLSVRGTVKGEGFTASSLNAALEVTMDSSRFRSLPVEHGELALTVAHERYDATASVRSTDSRADVTLHFDRSSELPLYSADASLASFDLATLFGDSYQSDLTLNAHAEGAGSDIDNWSTATTISLLPSRFRGIEYDAEQWKLDLDQRDAGHKVLSVSSPLADMEMSGRFDLDYASLMLAERVTNLVTAIRNHALPPDSVVATRTPITIPPHTAAEETMDFSYHFILKNLTPIADFFRTERFDGRGNIEGTMRSTPDELFFTCNGTLDEFYLGTSEKGFLLNDCTLSVELDSLGGNAPLEHLSSSIALEAGSALVNTTHFEGLKTRLTYHNTTGTISLNGLADSTYGIALIGETSIQPGTYVFDLDTLRVDVGPYRWQNKQDVQFRLNSDGTRILHAEMVHNHSTVSAAGILHHNGGIEGSATLSGYDLTELDLWLPKSRSQQAAKHFSGMMNARVDIQGTLENPSFVLALDGAHLAYRQSPIGTIAAKLNYVDTSAQVDVAIRGENADSLSSLTLRGTLPINLGFAGVEERFPDQPQALKLSASQFSLAVLDPLLAEVEDLTGKCTADIDIGGTPRDPEYAGIIHVRGAQCIFTPNNVAYLIDGDFQPSGNTISLANVIVKNKSVGGMQGEAHVKGSLTITDYAIAHFELTAYGQILLMSDATRETGATLYGPLLAETDQDGLTLKGTIHEPQLSGKLFVRNANLTFPPARENVPASNQLTLNHIIIDDTTHKRVAERKLASYFSPRGTQQKLIVGSDESSTFIDNLRYNLTIETRGTTAIRMIFTPATNEELYAELEGKISVISVQGSPSAYGEIAVLPHSYYNFIKRFDATGSLKFVGPWDNPELNIKATYEAYHVDDSLARAGLPSQQKVTVILDISGKRYEPKLAMSMTIQKQPGETATDYTLARGGDMESDAISFILTGKFRDEMTSADRRYLTTNVGSTASSGFASNLLSGILTNFLQSEFPGIRSAEITYQGGNPDVRVTADVLKGYVQFGGKILNNISNANVSYQVNLGEIFNNPSIHNLFLEIQHRDSDLTEERKTDEARIYYRFSF